LLQLAANGILRAMLLTITLLNDDNERASDDKDKGGNDKTETAMTKTNTSNN